jgi:hypothetical protein
VSVTCVETMPAGTVRLTSLYQPFEHCPVVPLNVFVYTFKAPATEGEYTSGATATTLASTPTDTAVAVDAAIRRRIHRPERFARDGCLPIIGGAPDRCGVGVRRGAF